MNNVKIVEPVRPQTMTVAKGHWTSEPSVVASDAGNKPRMARSDNIRIGRGASTPSCAIGAYRQNGLHCIFPFTLISPMTPTSSPSLTPQSAAEELIVA